MAHDPKRDTSAPPDAAGRDSGSAVEAVKEEARQLVIDLEQRYDRKQRGTDRKVKLGGPGNFGGGDLDDVPPRRR